MFNSQVPLGTVMSVDGLLPGSSKLTFFLSGCPWDSSRRKRQFGSLSSFGAPNSSIQVSSTRRRPRLPWICRSGSVPRRHLLVRRCEHVRKFVLTSVVPV